MKSVCVDAHITHTSANFVLRQLLACWVYHGPDLTSEKYSKSFALVEEARATHKFELTPGDEVVIQCRPFLKDEPMRVNAGSFSNRRVLWNGYIKD